MLIWMLPLILLSGCSHRELCYTTATEVEVYIDWSLAPEADVKGMTCYFYDMSGAREEVRYDFSNKTGGPIRIDAGTYRVVCFNNNSSVLQYRGTDRFETIESFTRSTQALTGSLYSLRAPDEYEQKRYTLAPEPLYTARLNEVEIRAGEGNERQVITLHPEASHYRLEVVIKEIRHPERVAGISAAMGGMAPGYFIGRDQPAAGSVYHPFELRQIEGQVEGHFYAYAVAEEETDQQLVLFIVLKDGKGYYYSYNVAEQLRRQSNTEPGGIIRIAIADPIELPDLQRPDEGGGGITPTVEAWQRMYIDLKM